MHQRKSNLDVAAADPLALIRIERERLMAGQALGSAPCAAISFCVIYRFLLRHLFEYNVFSYKISSTPCAKIMTSPGSRIISSPMCWFSQAITTTACLPGMRLAT